jgi:hypothetical protein
MRVDLHVHTWHSHDGISPPKKIIEEVKKGPVDGIAVTDHDCIDAWKHFENAGVPVVFGEEVSTVEGHLLCLFIQEKIKSKNALEVIDETHDQDGLVVMAHPFDFLRKGFQDPQEFARKVDGIEAVNSRIRTPFSNQKARNFALKNSRALTGGSDAHVRWEVGNAYTKSRATNLEEFKKDLEKNRTDAFGGLTIPSLLFVPKLAKLGFIGRYP